LVTWRGVVSGSAEFYCFAPPMGSPAIGPRIAFHRLRGKNMPLINIVIALVIVGVALYLINRYIPMASSIKSILNVVVVVAVAVWVLQAVGLWGNISSYRVGR
jgi:predicted membrane protein